MIPHDKALAAAVEAGMSRFNDPDAPACCESWRDHLTEIVSDAIAAYLAASPAPDGLVAEWEKLAEELQPEHDCCPFCGRDPYHYVDIGVGRERVAVVCCELGISLIQDSDEQLLGVVERMRRAASALRSQAARIAELEREQIVAPAECSPGCDDPHCPYSHHPLTLRQAYENSVARMRNAEARASSLAAELAEIKKEAGR